MQPGIAPAPLTPEQHAAQAAPTPLRAIGRPDTLTAQHVEVAIVLHAMLGTEAAGDYLKKFRVSPAVAQRILSPHGRRRGAHDAHGVRVGASC